MCLGLAGAPLLGAHWCQLHRLLSYILHRELIGMFATDLPDLCSASCWLEQISQAEHVFDPTF